MWKFFREEGARKEAEVRTDSQQPAEGDLGPSLHKWAQLSELENQVSVLPGLGQRQCSLSPRHPLPFAQLRECLGVLLPAWVCIWTLWVSCSLKLRISWHASLGPQNGPHEW